MEKIKEKSEKIIQKLGLDTIGIEEIDNLGFGLENVRKVYNKGYRETYNMLYGLKDTLHKNEDFGLYDNVEIYEKSGYNVFGVFKALADYKDKEYAFEGLRNILKRYYKKYKFPHIKETGKIRNIQEKMKQIFDDYILDESKERKFAPLGDDNLSRVFYLLFLEHIYEEEEQRKPYVQKKIDFGTN